MATPPTQTLATMCPKCGARFRVSSEMAGRKGRCAKCGEVFRVPKLEETKLKRPAAAKPDPVPQLNPVTCRVCQTLMYGRLDQVGKPIKCPDCHAPTVVPAPIEVKPKKQPAAIDGDQYEVWGVDDAPSLAEIITSQPKYIAVECPMCQTLMHGTLEQVGKKLKCPDCGTLAVVPQPKEPVKTPVAADDGFELEIDPALDPGERPHVIIPPRRPMLYEEEAEAKRKQQEERRARGDTRGPQYDDRGHAIMPRWPLATRILPFLLSAGIPPRWIGLSVGGAIGAGLMFLALRMAMTGGFGAIGGMALYGLALILLVMWFSAMSSIAFTIITQSSEGTDEIESWPGNGMSEWLGEFFYMLIACLMSPFPGWLIGRVIDPTAAVPGFMLSFLICLPIVILSQLDGDSAFAVCTPRVLASVVRMPLTWLMFYFEIALLLAICFGVTLAAERVPYLALTLIPLYVAAAILAARILGRLAWTLAESTPGHQDDETAAP